MDVSAHVRRCYGERVGNIIRTVVPRAELRPTCKLSREHLLDLVASSSPPVDLSPEIEYVDDLAIPVEGSGAMRPIEGPCVIPPEPRLSHLRGRLFAFAIVLVTCVATALSM